MKKIISILLICILICGMTGAIPASATTNDPNTSFATPEEMAAFIQSNLDEFVNGINTMNGATTYSLTSTTSIFDPSNCENQFNVQIVDTDEYVVCMDFNGDNGYMLVSSNAVIKLVTTGNLDHIYAYEGNVFFSEYDDDFVYYSEGDYHLFQIDESDISPSTYEGTTNNIITDRVQYLDDRYGDYEAYDRSYLKSAYTTYFTTGASSVYTRNGNTEGNCALVAIFNALSYLRNDDTYPDSPDPTALSTINPENDYFYNSAISNNYIVSQTSIPPLYLQIRQLAIASYGYTVTNGHQPNGSASSTSLGSSNTVSFIKTIGSYYGEDITVKKKSTTMGNIVKQIEDDKPVIWYMTDDSIYDDHAVTITGYYIYKQYTSILGINVCTNTINILRIANGWRNSMVYYDLESTSGCIFVFS